MLTNSIRSVCLQAATVAAILIAPLLTSESLVAQDWPNWRGPNYDGSTESPDLPKTFNKKDHVEWAADMPGTGASTPIVIADRIYLSSVDTKRNRLVALCLDFKTGKTIWSRDAGSGYTPGELGTRTARGQRTTYASPSPVHDGKHVIFFFGNGDLVAYGTSEKDDGKEVWRRNIQKEFGDFAFQWTFSASPTVWEGRLFLPVMQRDEPVNRGRKQRRGRGRGNAQKGEAKPAQVEKEEPKKPPESFLLAMDPATGKDLWKHIRPSQARKESLEAYTTMIPFVNPSGRKELVVLGGDVITGHDPETGKEFWRWGTWNKGHREQWWRIVPSAVIGAGVALVCAPKSDPVYAIQVGGDGDLGEKALKWKSEGRRSPASSDVPTPAFTQGHFYILNDKRPGLSKLDAKTGEILWTKKLSRDYLWRASPTVCAGKVYCINHNGQVVVVDCKTGEIVHETEMGEEDDDNIRSSIVIAHSRILIRSNTKLYCIAN